MNQELENRWEKGKQPFDGDILGLGDLIILPKLLESLRTICKVLKQQYSNSKLFTFEDWHQHDGYLTTENECSWKTIDEILISERTLYDSRSGDDYVRKAIFPENMNFLLRYYVIDEDYDDQYPGIWGDFDISGSPSLLTEIKSKLSSDIRLLFYEGPSKLYFDSVYAG